MSMDLRSRLQKKKQEAVREAAEKLLQDGEKDVGESVSLINLYSNLISALPQKKNRDYWTPIIVGIVCLNLAGLAWTVRVWWPSNIVLTAEADAVAFKLAHPWKFTGSLMVSADDLELYELSSLELPPESKNWQLKGRPWVRVKGGKASLGKLEVDEGNTFRMETDKNLLHIFSKGARFRGEIELWGETTVSSGPDSGNPGDGNVDTLNIDEVPETLVFLAENNPIVPVRIHFRPQEDLVFRELKIRDQLSLSREVSGNPGDFKFICALSKGKLVLSDVSKTTQLGEQECVTLNEPVGEISEISFRENKISLRFVGKAGSIFLRGDENITPTILEYFYYNQRLAFFWSAVISIWGGLWSIRKMLSF